MNGLILWCNGILFTCTMKIEKFSATSGLEASKAAFKLLSYSFLMLIQSTLIISTSDISNNRLSRRENLVRVLTQKSKIRLQIIVEKRRNCS